MNFLKKGPELKPSEIKVPGFVQDVYYDLKDRHLLPVAVVLLVAIIAVPIAISNSGSEEVAPLGEVGATQSAAPPQSGQLVAEAAPGLRDYHKRLDHRQATDPFVQDEEAQGEGSNVESVTESTSSPPSSPTYPSETGGSEPGSPEPTPTGAPKLTFYSFAIDVRVSGSGEEGSQKATVRRDLPELTMLPSRETPALVFMGTTKDRKKAVMTVSSDVQAIYGDAKCALGSDRCELLVMEPGLPVTLVYGGAGRTYKIELLKVNLIESDKLNKAPLGKPKKGQNGRQLSTAPRAWSGHPEEALRGRSGNSRLP